jgi:hypothetical protein
VLTAELDDEAAGAAEVYFGSTVLWPWQHSAGNLKCEV